jgi:hypothetical protein
VATANQYLPANRLLSEHIKSSDAFREQIAMMGQPDALRVERSLFSPTEVVLYYTAQDQQVSFYKRGAEWDRELPTLIDPEARAQILAQGGESDLSPSESEADPHALLPLITEAPIEFKARMSPGMLTTRTASLKRLKGGDYQHQVTFKGETLATIADWYSGKSTNATQLAKASHRPIGRALARGDLIVIPQLLMRNPVALPEAALR